MNDQVIKISMAGTRLSKSWQQTNMTWPAFCDRLHNPVVGSETLAEFIKLPKAQQDDLKDVGGFVGGTFRGLDRQLIHLEERSLITLDLDNVPQQGTEFLLHKVESLGVAAAVYSTRKHCSRAPRLRVIVPFDQPVSPDQYEPCARMLAKDIGIEYCDPTTFEGNRLMFWPSCSADSEYICKVYPGAAIHAPDLLNRYQNWADCTEWPTLSTEENRVKRLLTKQQDPLTKSGIVGAFCRAYSVRDAMDTFLPGLYEPGSSEDRFTYTEGSTANGAVLYQGDRFLYSHHATDPCSGKLVNAWDLVRVHKFGDLDADTAPKTSPGKLPSYQRMMELANGDESVKRQLRADIAATFQEESSHPVNEDGWADQLSVTENGKLKRTIYNVAMILRHDPNLKGIPATDEFSNRLTATGPLPWDTPDVLNIWKTKVKDGPAGKAKRDWTDTDSASLLGYVESKYDIGGKDRVMDALAIVANENKFNDVKDYLSSLTWDGMKRVDTLLTDYLGALDNEYTRAVIRKTLIAACGRAVIGATKFDNMPILTGRQGLGKSTFLRHLGGSWFSDSLNTFEGKEAAELIQGVWIVEVPELQAMNRSEANMVKQFISKVDDDYRPAYGRVRVRHPRRCVFFGTTNDTCFLKDQTGNRRFWPIDCGILPQKKSPWVDLPHEVDQIWAEAYKMFVADEDTTYMSPGLEKQAQEAQEQHRARSDWEGLIEHFLAQKIPKNWYSKTRDEMKLSRQFDDASEGHKVERVKICSAEIWELCLNGDIRNLNNGISGQINQILRRMPGWTEKRTNFGPYGTCRGFKKNDVTISEAGRDIL